MNEKRGNPMFIKQVKPITQHTTEAERIALIDHLCATRGTEYKGMKHYRSL
jgi:hypothetical protein